MKEVNIMKKFDILNTNIDLQDGDMMIHHTTIKSYDEKYNTIGKNLDGENFVNNCFLVITTMDGKNIINMDLNYVTNNGDIDEIETLIKGSFLRKSVIEYVINSL